MADKNPQVIFSWRAPLRPYKKRSKMILRFYVALALLLSLIVFFFGDKILLLPIWTMLFLFYTLTITPPPEVENRITQFGIEAAGVTLRWEELSHFYFTKKFGFYILTIVSRPPHFYHVYVVVPNEELKNKLIDLLSQYLIFKEKPQKSLVDKVVDFFIDLMPDEEIEVNKSSTPQISSATMRD
jgi:hypothetical protein